MRHPFFSPALAIALLVGPYISGFAQGPAPAARPGGAKAAAKNSGTNTNANSNDMKLAVRGALDQALQALRANRLPEAERFARAAVAASLRSAVAHNLLGVVLDRSGLFDAALAEFNTAISLDRNFVSARNNLGRALAGRGRTPEAIAEFERVLKIDPAHQQAHYNLGALYAESGDFQKASDHFGRARASAPEDPQLALAFLNVAYRAGRASEADSAADFVERAVAKDSRALFTLAT
ncbi:MAG TPA: tetratricopeptide repeat protein, partial [Blastocatellia bacterium]|nr:tetratricopeptide repeat protein [Blastocatellia bacterium]